jgi:hypothetical protein
MRWLKHMLTVGLLLAAGAVTVATAFSDHSGEYGKVALPSGGVVHLPKGTVTVYEHQGVGGLGFQVVPVAGGDPVPMKAAGGTISADGVQRSEVIGEHGAIAKLDVPGDGDYRVVATSDVPVGSSALEFGTNAATAVAAKWKLLAGLVLAAFLITLLPTPRPTRRSEDQASASTAISSSPPRAPYAG